MFLCYIDESGNTGNNLKDEHQPYLVLTALMVVPDNVRAIEDDVRALGYRFFGAESRNTDFEFHGDFIYNARKKDRYFRKLSLDKRLEILNEIIDLLLRHDSIMLGYIAMRKDKYYGKHNIQQTAFHLLVEKIEEWLQGNLNAYCLLIADEQDELEQKLIDDLDHFKQHGTDFGYKSIQINKIIDSVHFVQSHNNYLMQLTDVDCYIIRKGKEARLKIMADYKRFSEGKDINYYDWKKQYGNRGQVYFSDAYDRLRAKKSWIFTKDFP